MRRKPVTPALGASNEAGSPEKTPPPVIKPTLTHWDSDLGAAIAHDEMKVAHLCIHRGRIFLNEGDIAAAAADKGRAEETYVRAVEAAKTANPAGREAIQPLLLLLKADLKSFQISNATTTR